MHGHIRNDREDECDGDKPVALEHLAREQWGKCSDKDNQQCCKSECKGHHFANDRMSTLEECATMSKRTSDFLFNGNQETWNQCKGDEPQSNKWFEVFLA
jgi:hypothetical protein